MAVARSLPVAAGEVTVLGRAGGLADWLVVVAEALSTVVPSVGLVRLAVSGAGVEDGSGLIPATVLAQRLRVEVVAPVGRVVAVRGGTLFAEAGWRRFGVRATADGGGLDVAAGRRFPTPGWEAGLDAVADAGPSAGLVRAVIPAGVWVYPALPDQAAPDCNDLAFTIPVDVDRPMLLVGRPRVPAPDPEAVVAVADRLPRAVRRNLVIVPYGPGSTVCSQISDRLSHRWARTVATATGLPAPTTGRPGGPRSRDHDSAATKGPRLRRANSLDVATSARRGGRMPLGTTLAVAALAASGGIAFALNGDMGAGGDTSWATISTAAAVVSQEPAVTLGSRPPVAGTPTAQGAPAQSATATASRDPSQTPRPTASTPTPAATNLPTAMPDITGQPSPTITGQPSPTTTGQPNPTGRNLALSGSVTASSTEGSHWAAQAAIDGDRTTRWSSASGSDPQWIAVDLGSVWTLTEVQLVWETAYATSYRVETSTDGTYWTLLHHATNGTGGTVRISAATALARHVRVVGVQRATSYGYSLWEIEVR
ncbi:discoidin domain-containing protein [Salinispora oceanensis]